MGKTARKPTNLVKAIGEAQRAADEREKLQVASQPHRRGIELPMSTLAGSELGRFILVHITADMCFEMNSRMSIHDYRDDMMGACEAYARKTWKWCLAKGVPLPASIAWDFSSDQPNDDDIEESVKDWKKAIDLYESALKRAGLMAFGAARNLILFDHAVGQDNGASVRRALQALHSTVYS